MTTYKDEKGYERTEKEHTDLVHRNRAYHIYLQNRDKYPLPYSAYEVHHKDFDKTNNKVSNLQILTPSEHDKIHEENESKKAEERLKEEEKLKAEEQLKQKRMFELMSRSERRKLRFEEKNTDIYSNENN